jgi:hypothetical protein
MKLNRDQRIALMYYKAYSATCLSVHEASDMTIGELAKLEMFREFALMMYSEYDHKCSFDVSLYITHLPEE